MVRGKLEFVVDLMFKNEAQCHRFLEACHIVYHLVPRLPHKKKKKCLKLCRVYGAIS